jgi:hypothetical protein
MISLLSVPHSRKAAYSVPITLKTWSLLEVINVYIFMLVFFVQETTLVARCELHSVAEVKGSEVLLTINALNEFDSRITGVDWRQKIENQRGAVSSATFHIVSSVWFMCMLVYLIMANVILMASLISSSFFEMLKKLPS